MAWLAADIRIREDTMIIGDPSAKLAGNWRRLAPWPIRYNYPPRQRFIRDPADTIIQVDVDKIDASPII